MNFSAAESGDRPRSPIRTLHQHTQSVGATGGVYKGQGRNQRRFLPNEQAETAVKTRLAPVTILTLIPWTALITMRESSVRPPLGGVRLYLKHLEIFQYPPPFSL